MIDPKDTLMADLDLLAYELMDYGERRRRNPNLTLDERYGRIPAVPMQAIYNMENDELVGFTSRLNTAGYLEALVSDGAFYALPVKPEHYADLIKYRRALEGIPSCRP